MPPLPLGRQPVAQVAFSPADAAGPPSARARDYAVSIRLHAAPSFSAERPREPVASELN
jgi:hypothetical protein